MARIKNMGASTARFNEGVIVDGTAGDDVYGLIVTGSANISTDLFVEGIATYNTVEYFNSNTMKFNQVYYGDNNGSYFSANEYQKVITIIPSGASQNYQVIGRITAQNAGETHTVYFNAALRSNTLPDLNWTINYEEEYNGGRYIDPQLWTKETETAGFIFAFKTLATIYGNVTVDIDVVPRNSSQKANVTINNNQSSEQTSIDAGYTANDMIKVISKKGESVTISQLTGSTGISDQNGDIILGGIYSVDHGIFQNPATGYDRIYFPSEDSFIERVGPSSVNFQIAPFDGEVIKVQVKANTDFSTTDLTCSFHKGSGTTNAYSSTPTTEVALNGDVAWQVYTFDFMGQGATFSEGDVIGWGLKLASDFAGTETVHFTTVVKYNPYA